MGVDAPKLGDAIEDRRDRPRTHQRRSAAAKEDARYGALWSEVCETVKFAQIGGEESLLLDAAMADMQLKSQYGHLARQNGQCT